MLRTESVNYNRSYIWDRELSIVCLKLLVYEALSY